MRCELLSAQILLFTMLGGAAAPAGVTAPTPALLRGAASAAGSRSVGPGVREPVRRVSDDDAKAAEVEGAPVRVFFRAEPVVEARFASDLPGTSGLPILSVGRASAPYARFCLVEDGMCGSSLLLDADIGAGFELAAAQYSYTVPFTQFRVRGGATIRPLSMAWSKWTPWSVGLAVSWSRGSRSLGAESTGPTDEDGGALDQLAPVDAFRMMLVNQLWLSQRRHAPHVDFSIGGVRSSVLDVEGRYWGTSIELGFGFGGFASFFASGDFLDQNFRGILGFRSHGIAAGPVAGLVILGMLAGGALR